MNLGTVRAQASLRDRLPLSLCTSCDAAAHCGLRVQAHEPVWECEEFDPGRARSLPPQPAAWTEDASTGTRSAARAGLCLNCEERHTCRHSASEVGAWHCEDYR